MGILEGVKWQTSRAAYNRPKHLTLYKTDLSINAHKVSFCPKVGSQIANCHDVFLSYFFISLDLLWNMADKYKHQNKQNKSAE